METKHLEAVVAVAHHGSFTRAAAALWMAQSTLSRQVAAIERDLGARLFHRGPRKATLTTHGEAFLPEAARILEAVERAERAVLPGPGAMPAPRRPGAGVV